MHAASSKTPIDTFDACFANQRPATQQGYELDQLVLLMYGARQPPLITSVNVPIMPKVGSTWADG